MSASPDFIYIGPSKAGSSWLFERLRDHRLVHVPEAKDTYYFDRHYDRGGDWYRQHFGDLDDGYSSRGEICHDYLYSSVAAERIAQDLPDVRLMFGLRDPVDRALSHFRQSLRVGNVSADLHQALETNPAIVDHSRYARHLTPFLERFEASKMLVIPFESIGTQPDELLLTVFKFIEVEPDILALQRSAERVNPAAEARFPGSGQVARLGSATLRRFGMANTLGYLKRGPLKRVLFETVDRGDIPAAWRETLAKRLEGEAEAIADLLRKNAISTDLSLAT